MPIPTARYLYLYLYYLEVYHFCLLGISVQMLMSHFIPIWQVIHSEKCYKRILISVIIYSENWCKQILILAIMCSEKCYKLIF